MQNEYDEVQYSPTEGEDWSDAIERDARRYAGAFRELEEARLS